MASVHPRVRGDHANSVGINRAAIGSSPRSRGPRGGERAGYVPGRFIPAFAGTTRSCCRTCCQRSVHPRVRGDHAEMSWTDLFKDGSSPRSRGPRSRRRRSGSRWRFIPAFAGTTRVPRREPPRLAVHPRVRGDHSSQRSAKNSSDGSSPRSRGPLVLGQPLDLFRRFIPAFAGTT